jgi:thiosulfate/3-mercaptopyruvate sulfurtransferase
MSTPSVRRSLLSIAASFAAAAALFAATPSTGARESAAAAAAVDFERDWIVSPGAGRELVQKGALVVDARGADLKKKQGALAGAAAVEWQDLSEPSLPTKGRLLSDAKELDRRLQALGLTAERPVVVVADPVNGWGEDGRVAWALRTFGHRKVVIVDGGLPALQQGGPLAITAPVVPGTFHATFDPRWHVTKEEIRAHLGKGDLALLDVREPREYEGKTPYGEARGGHIPGAKGLWYKDLLGKDGKLLPRAEIEKALAARGITRDSNVVAYCTGGIRSGWFTTVLNDLGYKARNYPGSGWEWAGSPAADYPLAKD